MAFAASRIFCGSAGIDHGGLAAGCANDRAILLERRDGHDLNGEGRLLSLCHGP